MVAGTDEPGLPRIGPRPPESPDPASPVDWTRIGEAVGVVAGLVAWVGAVGGARLWARLESADIPAGPALAEIDPGAYVVEGLQTLLGPVLLGGVVALILYHALPSRAEVDPEPPHPHPRYVGAEVTAGGEGPPDPDASRVAGSAWWSAPLLATGIVGVLAVTTLVIADASVAVLAYGCVTAALVVAFGVWMSEPLVVRTGVVIAAIAMLVSLFAAVRWPHLLAMVLVTVIAAWVTLRALDTSDRGRVAVTLFLALVVWSGALGYAQELGDRTPDLHQATVQLTGGPRLEGYYVGRSATHLLIAQPLGGADRPEPDAGETDAPGRDDASPFVVSLPITDIASYAYGDEAQVPDPTPSQRPEGQLPGETPPTGPVVDPPEPITETGRPTSTGADRPPATAPAANPRDEATAITHKDATLGTRTAQVQVLSLSRQSGDYLQLEVRLWNSSDGPLPLDSTFGRSAGDASFSGVQLVDTPNDRTYGVAYSDDGCVCDKFLDQVTVPEDGWRYLSAAFMVRDPVSPALDVIIPGFGWIDDVPVS